MRGNHRNGHAAAGTQLLQFSQIRTGATALSTKRSQPTAELFAI